jgi:hypothetical protein
MTNGPSSLDVVPWGDRWLMAYVSPLGSTITVRSGLSPHGPWSVPVDVARCALADSDMFCAGLRLHPSLSPSDGRIVVSYAPASLSSDTEARRAAAPDAWWPRFAGIEVPSLP